jgi:hypothetical protein
VEANCLQRRPSTSGRFVVVIVVIVIMARPGFSAADVHQLLADITPLVGLILDTRYLAVSDRPNATG